jgi:hypothetical protein
MAKDVRFHELLHLSLLCCLGLLELLVCVWGFLFHFQTVIHPSTLIVGLGKPGPESDDCLQFLLRGLLVSPLHIQVTQIVVR